MSTADTVTVVAVKIVKPKSVAPSTPPRAAPRKKTAKARESPRAHREARGVHRDAGGGGKVSGRRLSSSSDGSTLTDVSERSTVRSQPTKSRQRLKPSTDQSSKMESLSLSASPRTSSPAAHKHMDANSFFVGGGSGRESSEKQTRTQKNEHQHDGARAFQNSFSFQQWDGADGKVSSHERFTSSSRGAHAMTSQSASSAASVSPARTSQCNLKSSFSLKHDPARSPARSSPRACASSPSTSRPASARHLQSSFSLG